MLTREIEYVMREVYNDRLREARNERLARQAERRARRLGLRAWLASVLATALTRNA